MGKNAIKQSPIKTNITFSDTLLESSNPDRLVDYLRLKRNLPRPPKELFSNDNNDKPRKSFQVELKPYQKQNPNNKESEQQNELEEPIEVSSDDNSPIKTRLPRVLLYNDVKLENHQNAKKSLLQEFEMTIKQNEFQPPVFSTPLNSENHPLQKCVNELSENNKNTCNNKNVKESRKISSIIKIKPLSASELEDAKLIEKLERERIETNVENRTNVNLNQPENENIEIEQLTQFQQSAIPITETEINQNNILEIPETERFSETEGFEIEEVIIPDTQESQNCMNEIYENSEPLPDHNYIKSIHGNYNKEKQFLPPKSPNRLTFTIHKLDKTVTPPRRQNEFSPKLVKIASSSQMSPLARRAQTQLHSENNYKKSQSKIPKIIRTDIIRKVSTHKNLTTSPLKRSIQSHSEKYINESDNDFIENVIEPPANIVVPIYQTVNILKDVPEQTILSSSIPDRTTVSSPIPDKTIVTSPIPPPTGFCDETIITSPNQNKNSANPKNKSNNEYVDMLVKSSEEIRSLPLLINNELLTDDEDISLHSIGFVENIPNNNSNKTEFLTNIVKNKTNLQKNPLNKTTEAIDLRTTRSSKRKSSLVAQHHNGKKVKVLLSRSREIENKQKHYDLLNIDVNSTNEQNKELRELLTPRYTPPPPLTVNNNYLSNQESFEKSSIQIDGRISKRRKNEINLDKDFMSRSSRKHQATDLITTAETNYDFRSKRSANTLFTESHSANKETNTSKSRKSNRNKSTLSTNRRSDDAVVANVNSITDKNDYLRSFRNVTDIQFNKEIENEIDCENNNSSNDMDEELSNTNSNNRNSPILSRHATFSFLKTNNFNINNNFQISKEDKNETVDQKKKYNGRKSRSRKRIRKNRISSSSPSPEKTNLNIVDANINSELVIDNPNAMNNFWRNSIANRSKLPDKKDKNDSLKSFYLNVDKTINNQLNLTTISGRRKLYSKGQSDVEKTPNKNINNENLEPAISNTKENNVLNDIQTKIRNNKVNHNRKSTANNNRITDQIIDNIRADWQDIDEIEDDENPNHTTSFKQSEKSILNNCNKEKSTKSLTNIANKILDETNIKLDDNIFKIPNLPVPKSSSKKKQSNQQNTVTNKKKTRQEPENISSCDDETNSDETNSDDNIFKKPNLPAPKSLSKKKQSNQQNTVTNKKKTRQKQQPDNINSGDDQIDSSSRFGTPRRTSTKLAYNIEKDLNDKKKKTNTMALSENDTEDTFSDDTTSTIRRSRRRACPRVAYWLNERLILDDPFKINLSNKKKRNFKNVGKKNKISIITEENEVSSEQPSNIENQPGQLQDQCKTNSSIKEKQYLKKKVGKQNKTPTITEENEVSSEPTSNIENQLTQLGDLSNIDQLSQFVDIIRENLSVIEENNKKLYLPDKELEDANKSKKKTKNKTNKKQKKSKDENKDNTTKTNTIAEPTPSTSKEVAEPIPSTSNVNVVSRVNEDTASTNVINYDSGNATDTYNNTKENDKYSWLRKLVTSNTSSSSSSSNNLIVERLILGKDFELASFNCMTPVEKDGVEYYISSTSSAHNFGFIKLKPNSVKPPSKLKNSDINFILFSDELQFTIGKECVKNTKAGEVVVIKKNKSYSVANKTDTEGLLLFLKI